MSTRPRCQMGVSEEMDHSHKVHWMGVSGGWPVHTGSRSDVHAICRAEPPLWCRSREPSGQTTHLPAYIQLSMLSSIRTFLNFLGHRQGLESQGRSCSSASGRAPDGYQDGRQFCQNVHLPIMDKIMYFLSTPAKSQLSTRCQMRLPPVRL